MSEGPQLAWGRGRCRRGADTALGPVDSEHETACRPGASRSQGSARGSGPRVSTLSSVGLELEHVDKAKRQPILKDVSLAIRPGEAVGLVGPNGVGKTTLFKVAVGLWQPDRGHVRWDGTADGAAARARRAGIGVVGELAPLYPYLSCRDHLEMKRRVHPGVGADRISVVRSALGLEAFWTVPTHKLSQGQRQRVALATALLPDPPFLLLDEATNGLDPDAVRWLRDTIANLSQRGTAVCVSSHVLGDLVKMVTRVLFLKGGTVVADEMVGDRSAEWMEERYQAVMGSVLTPLA